MTATVLTLILLVHVARNYPKARISLFSKRGLRNTTIAGFAIYLGLHTLASMILTF